MAYVGDNGKRVAPKHASRTKAKPPAHSAPHPVQTPPGGDIASSGGDYGTHRAKRYSASRAFRQSVRQTYAAQPAKQRKQVSRGAVNRPGPAAAAIRHEHTSRVTANRRAAGLNTPSGNIPGFGQAQQQRRSQAIVSQILQAHKRTPISSTGDTKSNLELATAEAFKATPRYASDFDAAVSAGRSNSPKVPGTGVAAAQAPTGVAGFIESSIARGFKDVLPVATESFKAASNITTLARKQFGPGYEPGYKNIPTNLVKQALDIPAQAVPSVTKGIIEPAARGDIKTAASTALGIQTYKDIAKHPVREIQEHPLSTGLAFYGPLKGASNLARAGAVRTGAIPPLRPEKIFPNSGLTSPPKPVARGIVGATVQTIKDRPIRKGLKPPEQMSARDVRIAAYEHQHSAEQRRRVEREVAARSARTAIGKKVTPAHILASQNYIRTIGDVREYLGQVKQHQNRYKQEHAKLQKDTPNRIRLEHKAKIKAQQQNINALEKFLNSKEISGLRNEAELPPKMQAEVEAYKALSSHVQKKLGDLYGEAERIKMRGLLPYAQKYMGASHVKSGFVDVEADASKLISKEEKAALRKELPDEEFEARVRPVHNVWQVENKIIKPDDIEKHQKLEGPKIAPEVAAEGELSIRQRELSQLEREAATHHSRAVKRTWGVTDDKELTDLRKQLEDISPVDPRKTELEGDLALSIVEKRDLARAAGKDVSHGMTKEELRAVENLATVRQKVLETERKINDLRSREASPEGATLSGSVIRPRIKELEGELSRLKKEQSGRVADWINERKLDPTKGVDPSLPSSLYKKLTDKQKEVEALKGRIETEKGNRPNTISPAAYISHAPNRNSIAAYFVSTSRAQKITPSGYTGKALEEGLSSLHKDVPIEDLVKSQGLVTAIQQYGKMVRDISIRKDAVPKETEGLVHDPDHPEVATFESKSSAARIAEDWNATHPDHPVAPYRISFTKGAQETILGDESDVQAGMRAENAMISAIKGEDTKNSGHWALGPSEFLKQSEAYLGEKRPISRMIGSQFRRTVLALSIPWMVGNFGEAALRSALERSGPRSYYTGKHILKYLQENDSEAFHYLQGIATGGGHYGLRRSAGIYTGAEHLQNAGPTQRALGDAIMKLKTNKITGPPARGMGHVWDAWTDFVFDQFNGPIESQFQTAMMGKAFRENLMSTELRKLSKKAMNEAIEGKINPRTMDMLGREVDRMYGKYSKFSPGLKRWVSHSTPFIAWYLNAVRFIYHTMPKHHPIVTSVINNADAATREWRKDKGLGLFLEGHVPSFLQGSIPTRTGNLRVARYTPFGLMGDPYGALPGIIFPQGKTVILNMMGLDWKGDPIPGAKENPPIGYAEAIKSLTAQLVPGYTMANKAVNPKEGESTGHHVRRTIGDPFLESKSPQQLKKGSSSGGKSYFGTTKSKKNTSYFGARKKKSSTSYFGGK